MKFLMLVPLLLFASCSSGPYQPTQYTDMGWAKTSTEQARAECQAEINRPGGIPNMYLCMRAKGWQEH